MKLTIHEDAAKAIDADAETIRSQVRTGSFAKERQAASWTPDVHMTQVDPSDLRGPIRLSNMGPAPLICNIEGKAARFLRGQSVTDFQKVETRLLRALKPKGAVSAKAVEEEAHSWLLNPNAGSTLSQHCVGALAQKVRPYTIWVPIAELHIQSSFAIGSVTFRTITADLLRTWKENEHYSALSPTDRAHVDAHYARLDQELRGLAAGTVTIEAEPIAAREFALDTVEDALNILRLFAAPALMPRLRSHCAPKGQENIQTFQVFLEADGKFSAETRGFLSYSGRPWVIRDDELAELKQIGLDTLGSILASSSRTTFQSRVLAAVDLYSESTRETRLTTRLVLMLAALEGLFLKDANEPIAQNLGERLAILAKQTPEERLAVVQLVRRVYAQRSKFVHHSEHVEMTEDIEEFVRVVWFALLDVVANMSVFKTPQEFLDHLDLVKMSGRPFAVARTSPAPSERP